MQILRLTRQHHYQSKTKRWAKAWKHATWNNRCACRALLFSSVPHPGSVSRLAPHFQPAVRGYSTEISALLAVWFFLDTLPMVAGDTDRNRDETRRTTSEPLGF